MKGDAVHLAREWFWSLTPIETMRTEALAELRAKWSVEDGVGYFRTAGIPVDCERGFRVYGELPRRSVADGPLAASADLRIPTHYIQPNRYALPDGRDLFFIGRCRELATVYAQKIDPPIDHDRLALDLGWIVMLWDRIGRTAPRCIAAGMAALSTDAAPSKAPRR